MVWYLECYSCLERARNLKYHIVYVRNSMIQIAQIKLESDKNKLIHHQILPWIIRCIVMSPTLTMMNTLSDYVRNATKTHMICVIGSHELSNQICKPNRSVVENVMAQNETILTCNIINVQMWFDWNLATVTFVSHRCSLHGRRLRTNINPTQLAHAKLTNFTLLATHNLNSSHKLN